MSGTALSRHSLRLAITRAIVNASLATVLVAVVLSGISAFIEAGESQDELLVHISALVRSGHLNHDLRNGAGDGEQSLLIQSLSNRPAGSGAAELAGLSTGLHTVSMLDSRWRVNIQALPSTNERYMVAQPIDVRVESALAGVFYSLVPTIAVVLILLLLVNRVVTSQLHRLDVLADSIDADTGDDSRVIDQAEVPAEVRPFLDAIARLLDRNGEILRRQQRFVADAAHELRTPIAALLLQTDNLLSRQDDDAERQPRGDALRQSVVKLQRLVTQLLDLARLQNPRTDRLAPVQWQDVIRDVVTEKLGLAGDKGIDLGVGTIDSAWADDGEHALGRLLGNALDNAIRYTPPGGQVDVSLSVRHDVAELTIDDTGPGIPPAELADIFEPFNRGDPRSRTSEDAVGSSGTGLGLSICREIAARLGGTIQLENREQGGLRFVYRQPIAHTPPV